MYVDTQLPFSDSQAVTATAVSTNVIDLVSLGLGGGSNVALNVIEDMGNGEPIYLVVQTAVAVTGGTSPTLTVTLESSTTADLATSPTVHYSSGALATATYSSAGTQFIAIALPMGDYKRYVGLRFTVASGPFTAGAFDAFLTHDVQRVKAYKSAFTVQ